ncbi:YdeI/OmpD-associated family protein [Maricaulis sp.]|uniref:YdeI/OmpD-associated family protein n=1 Tax=Maricaulis sp. TaxID=1486257 RepID=UPI003A92016D
MITDAGDFFTKGCGRCARFATPDCSVQQWVGGLNRLRRICLDAGLDETVKWGHPCYMHAGRNIALLSAFRGDFRLTFLNAALLKDPEGVLEKQGPNSQHAGMIRLTDAACAEALEPVIRSYLAEAMGYAQAGIRPPRQAREVEWPDELVDALDADPELAEAFGALTPGRQRSYAINLGSAKKSETRIARIAKFRDRILAGKGAMER